MNLEEFLELTAMGELYVIKRMVRDKIGVKRLLRRKDGRYYESGPVRFMFTRMNSPDLEPKVGYYIHYLAPTKSCDATQAVLSPVDGNGEHIDITKVDWKWVT